MADRYAVIGNPISHSKSPEIHAAFARECGQDMQYERLLAPMSGFVETVDAFRRSAAKGANVTLPFKIEAFNYATERSQRARRGGTVNTLRFEVEKVIGDNTDGVGLCRDIEGNLGRTLRGARILLVGAGGAARGVVGALLDCEPQSLVITNRTHAKAQAIVDQYAVGTSFSAHEFATLASQRFDV
ncbi:MAG: shikimate dehydrogenase, partial [Usitatibacteraceae bacterium]